MFAPGERIPHPVNDAMPEADRPLRLPRPLPRPEVDASTAEAFARPAGVSGGQDPRRDPPRLGTAPTVRTDDPVLAEAFGPTEGDDGPLGRPLPVADARGSGPVSPPDPWRDPHAPVTVGAPALDRSSEEPVVDLTSGPPPTRLGLGEVVFDRRVSWQALGALAAAVAVVALVAGAVGSVLADSVQTLTANSVRLSDVPDDLVGPDNPIGEMARRVQPAVVNIQVASEEARGEGSGIVIDPRGYIVTNNHVATMKGEAGKDPDIQVVFSDGNRVPAKIVGTDPLTDLAVLKVEDVRNLTVATLGRSPDVAVGQQVVAFGSPLGLSKTVTQGIVSAVQRPIALGEGASDGDVVIDAVQTDAAINPGNSGGPLVDLSGAVIGINTSIFSNSGGSIGLGFAIPVDDVREIATALIETGSVKHATIGVSARTAANGAVDGAEIVDVAKDSAAGRGGLVEGDVVVRVGDRTVHSGDELVVAVRRAGADRPVSVEVIRDGKRIDLELTPTLG